MLSPLNSQSILEYEDATIVETRYENEEGLCFGPYNIQLYVTYLSMV